MLEHVLNLLSCFLQLERTKLVDGLVDWRLIILQIDFEFMAMSHRWVDQEVNPMGICPCTPLTPP